LHLPDPSPGRITAHAWAGRPTIATIDGNRPTIRTAHDRQSVEARRVTGCSRENHRVERVRASQRTRAAMCATVQSSCILPAKFVVQGRLTRLGQPDVKGPAGKPAGLFISGPSRQICAATPGGANDTLPPSVRASAWGMGAKSGSGQAHGSRQRVR